MGTAWVFAPWHEPRRIAGQIALCIISGHWPYSSCQNKWPGYTWQDQQQGCLPCLQGHICRGCSRRFVGCARMVNVSQGMPASAYRSGTGLSVHAGQAHYGPVIECCHGFCSGSIRKTSFQSGAHQVLPCIWGDGHGGQLQWSERLQGSKVPAFLILTGTGMHFVICSCSSEYGYCAIGVAFTCLQHRLLFRQQSLPEVYVSLLADREYLFRLVCAQA